MKNERLNHIYTSLHITKSINKSNTKIKNKYLFYLQAQLPVLKRYCTIYGKLNDNNLSEWKDIISEIKSLMKG